MNGINARVVLNISYNLECIKKIPTLDGLEFKVELCWEGKRRKLKYLRDRIQKCKEMGKDLKKGVLKEKLTILSSDSIICSMGTWLSKIQEHPETYRKKI